MDETGNFSLPKSGVENGTQWRSCLNKIRHLALQEWVAFCSRKVVVPIAALVAKNLKVVPLLLASRAVLLNESAFGRHLWFSLSAKKTSKRCKSTLQKQCTTGANLRKKGQMSAHSKIAPLRSSKVYPGHFCLKRTKISSTGCTSRFVSVQK